MTEIITDEDLRNACLKALDQYRGGGLSRLKTLLNVYGNAERIRDVKPENRRALLNAIEQDSLREELEKYGGLTK